MVGLLVIAILAIAGPRAIAAEGDVTGFEVPSLASVPHGVARGSDGAIWFTERLAGQIGRLDDGVFTEYALPQSGSDPTAIVSGPDGNLWFVEQATDQIGRITTAGLIAEFPLLTPNSTPVGIAAGPDGALWFTERGASQIGRITTDGLTLTEWPTPTENATPTGITAGPDGALWFTERGVSRIGRITTEGQVTEFALPAGSLPTSIAAGPDGNLWVTLRGLDSIARVSTSGVLEAEIPIPTAGAQPTHIVAGPQGALWFTESTNDMVGRITTDGQVTEYPLAPGAGPQGIVEGSDGSPWFAEANANRIARLELGGGPTDTTAPIIEIRAPLGGTPFVLGQQTAADYACVDEVGGSGLLVCEGPVATGAPIPTGELGAHTFAVRAVDLAGNGADAATSYLVFRSVTGSLVEPSPRPGSWLTLSLGMDLARGADPLAAATTQEVDCAQGDTVGSAEAAAVRTRVTHDGELDVRWDTVRSWAGTCRTLTLTFSPEGWDGVPVTFLVSWASAARR